MTKPVKDLVKISDITKFANALANSIRGRLAWSTQLRNSVKVHKGTGKNGSLSIKVTVGEGKDKSGNPLTGMARAYEFGSGLHRKRGTPAKYVIRPRKGKRLSFDWPKAQPPFIRGRKLAGKLPDGRLSFFYVEHPGVEARPYIRYALQKMKQRATEELKMDIRRNVKNELSIALREAISK